MDLDENLYRSVKSALLSRAPLLTLDEAYNALTHDKKSKLNGRMNDDRNETVSFAIQTASKARCTFINRGGKDISTTCGK